jgi:hypothetical protein
VRRLINVNEQTARGRRGLIHDCSFSVLGRSGKIPPSMAGTIDEKAGTAFGEEHDQGLIAIPASSAGSTAQAG